MKKNQKLIQYNTDDKRLKEITYPEFVCKVKTSEDSYQVELNDLENKDSRLDLIGEDKPWLIIRYCFSDCDKGYKIKLGDYLKFGKIVFKIREIKIEYNGCSEYIQKIKEDKQNKLNNRGKDYSNLLGGGSINVFRRNLTELIEENKIDNTIKTSVNITINESKLIFNNQNKSYLRHMK
jgi:hypothetical protein